MIYFVIALVLGFAGWQLFSFMKRAKKGACSGCSGCADNPYLSCAKK